MKHAVAGRVRGAVRHQHPDRIIEGQPLRDADRQLALAFQFLVDQKIIPVGVVLNRGHSVRRRILERQQNSPPAQVVGGSRDMALNKLLARVFPDNASQITLGIVIQLPAFRIWRLVGHPDRARAAELATAMCPSTRTNIAGWPPVTASRSCRVGNVLPAQRV